MIPLTDHHLTFCQLNLHIRNRNVRPQRRYVQTPAQSIISFLLRLFASQPPFPRTTFPRLPPCRVLIIRVFVVFSSLSDPQQSYQHNQYIGLMRSVTRLEEGGVEKSILQHAG